MFNTTKYTKWYFNIINKAISENRIKLNRDDENYIYYELHHIIPSSLGGDNNKNNLVLLTAREHCVCHLLLIKMVEGFQHKFKMICAYKRFGSSINSNDFRINSRIYSKIKQQYNSMLSAIRKGKVLSEDVKDNMRKAKRKYFEKNPGHFAGKKHRAETIEKMRENNLGNKNPQYGKPRTDEEKRKISNTMKGVPKKSKEGYQNRKWWHNPITGKLYFTPICPSGCIEGKGKRGGNKDGVLE